MNSTSTLPVRVLTHNIRYATTSPVKDEKKWHIRGPRVIAELRFNTNHCPESFICLQEVLHDQLLDILSGLNSGQATWAHIGVGRSDGHEAGEYSPILYQPALWLLQSYETLWLSETPDRPSKGWDAACIRVLTLGVFQHHHSKKRVVAMNTHLDDKGSKSRLEATKIILERISHFTTANTDRAKPLSAMPIFLAGDFNSEPNQEAYKSITSPQSPMCDLHDLVPEDQRYGDLNTFTGFGHELLPPQRIDFLFLNHPKVDTRSNHAFAQHEHSPWGVNGYGVLPNRFEDGVYCSDHRAVVGDFLLQ